jgi:hypothetical protein
VESKKEKETEKEKQREKKKEKKKEMEKDKEKENTCSLISLLHTTMAVLIGLLSMICVESYRVTLGGKYIFL